MENQLFFVLALMFGAALLTTIFARRPDPPVQLIQIIHEPTPAPSGAGILILLVGLVIVLALSIR